MRKVMTVGGMALAFLLATATGALAQSDTKKLIENGKNAYMIYCSQCHGEDGKGNGPMAAVLKVVPANLTRLRTAEMKDFPYETVHKSIEGRMDTKGHGARKMPLWGLAFAGEKSVLINQLIYFLETLQEVK